MNLKELIKNLKIIHISKTDNPEIKDIVYDSRKAVPGSIFVCLEGAYSDGHDFIEKAVKNGAVVVVSNRSIVSPDVTVIQVEDTRSALATLSVEFFKSPAKKLITIAITGTKGKTTTSFMIKSILESAGIKTGLIGTVGAVIGSETTKLNNTTPESYEIQKQLQRMSEANCKCVIIETSSIGLKNHRVDEIVFDYGIFTNFSADHIGLNEHADMKEYLECKRILFKKCKIGFINIDDDNYKEIIKGHSCVIKTFGFNDSADYSIKNIRLINKNGGVGISCDFCGINNLQNVYISLPGKFNVYNALAAASVCQLMGIPSDNIIKGLGDVKVKGRVEPIKISEDYSLFIDYAHNAVSMKNILTTLKEYNPSRLITLFGAGGNRPKIRRYEMGEVSGKISDLSIITSDNPRYEEPMEIIEDIKKGINKTHGKYIIIPNRKEAIKYCIDNAQKGDIILLAGKGHEDYQEIKGQKYPFDERKIVAEIIKNNSNL